MFTDQDFTFLGEVFSLARLEIVKTHSLNKQVLENILNFENSLFEKLQKVNGTNDSVKLAEPTPNEAIKEVAKAKIQQLKGE